MLSPSACEDGAGVAGLGFATRNGEPGTIADPSGRFERLPVFTQLGVRAALDALAPLSEDERDDTAVVVSTTHGPVESMREFVAGFRARGHARANPFLFPNVLYNALAGEVAVRAKIRGPNVTLTSGDISAAGSLEVGLLLLRTGRARRVLVLAVEDGGPLVQRACARLRRHGLGGSPPVSHLTPFQEDTAVALLLDPGASAGLRIRRARTGHADGEAGFEEFVAGAAHGLDVSQVLHLNDGAPTSLGRFVSTALALPPGTRSLLVQRAEGGQCGAVAFENLMGGKPCRT